MLPEPITAYSFRLGRTVQFQHRRQPDCNQFTLVNPADEPNEDGMTLADYAKRDKRRDAGVAAMTWSGNTRY